jgi:hemolysin activation/secretion protein
LLNSDKLDRSVLLIDDLPGFGVLGSLKKGGAQSQTDLVLKLKDGPRINGNVNMDNSGSRATGSARINGNFYLNSPLGFGDLAVINMIHSEGTDYARAGYSIPVGDDGMRVGVNGSYSSYDLVADEYKTLDARGKFFTAGLEASYPIVRARTRNLYIDLNADHRNFDNQVGITTTSKYSVNNIGVGLSGNLFDRFGGSNVFGVKLARGNVILGELNSSENSSLGGSFLKLNYNLSRQQSINESLSFFAGLNGQISNTNLDSSEKIYLGGINGVRAYPANEAGGTDGQILNLEVRKRLPNNFGVTGFYDLGHVQVGLNNGSGPDNITLKGVGASLSWQANFGLALRATWSRRLGDNPNPTSTGSDQDGSLHKHRFWLTASMPF